MINGRKYDTSDFAVIRDMIQLSIHSPKQYQYMYVNVEDNNDFIEKILKHAILLNDTWSNVTLHYFKYNIC